MYSVIIPCYNESGNINELFARLLKGMDPYEFEIVFVDDGSTDRTWKELLSIKEEGIKLIKLRKNYGQTAALDAGFKNSSGEVIITMDADLQNNPTDIPALINKFNEGFDAVVGWRAKRQDPFFKKIVSRSANLFRRIITGEKIHDAGCSLKIFKKDCVRNLKLFGETHRFLATIFLWKGFKVAEIPVSHNPRRYGKTKYGLGRILKGFLDLLVLRFWVGYSYSPIYLFGSIGLGLCLIGFVPMGYLIVKKILDYSATIFRPLLFLSIFLILAGVQFIFFGVITDILSKNYYKDVDYYEVEEIR